MLLFLNIGSGELFMIVLMFLLFFGAKSIPDVARTFGKAMREFKDATGSIQREINNSTQGLKNEIEEQVNTIKEDADLTKNLKS